MKHREHLDRLRAIPGLATLDDRTLEAVRRAAVPTLVAAGTVLMTEGLPGREAFIVESGTLSVRHGDDEIGSIGAGGFVGELAAIDGAVRSATVVCETDCSLLAMSIPDFRRLVADSPAIARRLMVSLTERLRQKV